MAARPRHAWATAVLAAGLLGHAAARADLSPASLFEQAAPSVWTVRTQDANGRALLQGSAVVIGPGQLVTNCHVLRRAQAVAVTRENVSYGATLEHPDTERDLCTLRVANFSAPAVAIAPPGPLRVGSRVYALGSPRGLETTISDGLLSGIRRNARGDIEALQISVPISSGSSGGGLFDERGRLIGITTAGLRDAQNLNFALPAGWIADLPARAQAALAALAVQEAPKAAAAAPTGDRVFEYRLRDRITGIERTVVYRLDRVVGDELFFNQGDRVERASGGVLSMKGPTGGEFDVAMPPGGWITSTPELNSRWTLNYSVKQGNATTVRMRLRARVLDTSSVRIGARELDAIRVEFQGYTHRNHTGEVGGAYAATAWFSPALRRVVRFDVRTQGGNGGAYFNVDELFELIDIRSE